MPKSDRKHTPIVSEKQRGFFGAELGRLREGKKTKTGMSEEQLKGHLQESGGKSLPEKINKSVIEKIDAFLQKGAIKGAPGLVPRKVRVRGKGGKVFERTQWIKPEEALRSKERRTKAEEKKREGALDEHLMDKKTPVFGKEKELVALQRWHAREGNAAISGNLDTLREIYKFTTARGPKLKEFLNFCVREAVKTYYEALKNEPTKKEFKRAIRDRGVTHVPEILSIEERKAVKKFIEKKPLAPKED